MNLQRIEEIGNQAVQSREARSEIQKESKVEFSRSIYSQRDLQSLLKSTNKPIAINTLKEAMNRMEDEGYEFTRGSSATRPYQLSIEDCYNIGDYIGVTRYRDQKKPAFVINVGNLKGGVGKSLGTSMLAEGIILDPKYLMQQHRVLIIDLDPQATSTQQFLPGYEIGETDVTSLLAMADAEVNRENLFKFGIKKTIHQNLDILPCGTHDGFIADQLDDEEITQGTPYCQLLKERIIKHVEYDYDFIFLDAGPHMDKVLKNALFATNGIFIPVVPTFYNWDSTTRFLERLPEVFNDLASDGYNPDSLKIFGAYVSKKNTSKRRHDTDIYDVAVDEMYTIFGQQNIIKHALDSEEVYERCAEHSATVFSMSKKAYKEMVGSTTAFDRAHASAKDWAKELIDLVITHHD